MAGRYLDATIMVTGRYDHPKALIETLSENLLETFRQVGTTGLESSRHTRMDCRYPVDRDVTSSVVPSVWVPAIPARTMSKDLQEIAHDKEAADERKLVTDYAALLDGQADAKSRLKAAHDALEAKIAGKYGKLTEAEIKTLVVEDKWLAQFAADVQNELERVSQALTGRILERADRYATPVPQLTTEVETLARARRRAYEGDGVCVVGGYNRTSIIADQSG